MSEVYVSVTGFRLKAWWHLPLFWWFTLRSISQAREAEGNLRVEAGIVAGVYHTLTVWTDERSMRNFITRGAHFRAMKVYRSIGIGRTLGFTAAQAPDWNIAMQRWIAEAKEV
jgi:hypothetical protein